MSRERYMEVLFRVLEAGIIPRTQQRPTLCCELILTHFIQQIDKHLILLPEYVIQLHIDRLQLLHHLCMEEVRPIVILRHRLLVIALRHYR